MAGDLGDVDVLDAGRRCRDEHGGGGDESESKDRQQELLVFMGFSRHLTPSKRNGEVLSFFPLFDYIFCIASRNQTSVLTSSTSDFTQKCLQ